MKRLYSLLTLLIAITYVAYGAASVTVIPPNKVAVGDKFAVTVRVTDGDLDAEPSAPSISGCKFLIGPSRSISQESYYSNGHHTSTSRSDYTFYYRADEAGNASIPAMSLKVGGKTLNTKAVSFTIAKSQAEARDTRNKPVQYDDIDTQRSDRPVTANDVFVRIILSKSTAYEQEAIECTIKLYTKYGIAEFFPTQQPSFDGFLIQEIDLQPSLNREESYNGQLYKTAELKKCIIFPQKSGKLTINSGNYDVTVYQYDQVPMGYFVVNTPTQRKISITSNTASIDIKPLPSPAPEGFTGAVGQFSAESKLVGNNFHTGEAASLIYTIKGTGNIKYLKEPQIDFPSEFEQYTPRSEFDGGVQGNNVTGVMTFEYTFIPQEVGTFHIGSDKFVYFNPAEKKYVTINTKSYDVTVKKGQDVESHSDIKAKNTDILHIKQGVKAGAGQSLAVDSLLYWLLFIIVLIGFIVAVYLYGRNIKLAADVEGRKLARADKVARKRLQEARKLIDLGDDQKFYAEILSTIWGYLSDKLTIPASRLSRDNVTGELQKFGATDDQISTLIGILDDCEMARYAPVASTEKLSQVYDSTAKVINEIGRIKSPSRKN